MNVETTTAQKVTAIKDQLEISSQEVKDQIRAFLGADQRTSNRIWMIIISAFAIVLVGSAAALGWGLWHETMAQDKGTTPQMMLTLFTTVSGFLAGLVAQSPVK